MADYAEKNGSQKVDFLKIFAFLIWEEKTVRADVLRRIRALARAGARAQHLEIFPEIGSNFFENQLRTGFWIRPGGGRQTATMSFDQSEGHF